MSKLCPKHFKCIVDILMQAAIYKRDLENELCGQASRKRNFLLQNSVPNINLPHKPLKPAIVNQKENINLKDQHKGRYSQGLGYSTGTNVLQYMVMVSYIQYLYLSYMFHAYFNQIIFKTGS